MRRYLAGTLAAIVLTAHAITPVAAANSPFTGAWESIDFDGSYQVMTIGGVSQSGSTRVVLFDSFGSICVAVDGSSTTFHGLAEAQTSGNTLDFIWRHVGCGDVEAFYELGGGSLVYDAQTDEITDAGGITWTRIGMR